MSIRRIFAPQPLAPARIRAAVAAYENESERIVGWIQLAGVAIFAALYAATYAAFDIHRRIEPAPIALALYGIFTIWRLRRSYSGGLSGRLRGVSATLDVALLMAMIAAFPLQYDEPAALYLKAPSLFYAFILISLRALRFDPALVLWTGVAAAAGWALLAVRAGLEGAPLTGDYRIYMTSLSLLPGAELEKIASILAASGVLALGIGRARELLFRIAKEEAATADLSKFVGRDAAQRIRSSGDGVKSGDGEVRRAAIMFIDLRGFTPATKDMPPQDVIALLQEYHSRMAPVIEEGGGAIDKYLGDGILVSFGAARPTGRECADALKTALAVDRAATTWREDRLARRLVPFDVGISVADGDVVYGAVGHGDRLEYTVIGDAVNFAAKLEKHAKAAGARILTAARTVEMAAAQGYPAAPLRLLRAVRVDGAAGIADLAALA